MTLRTPSDERVAALIHDATAAPSMHNAQPWQFRYHRSRHTFEVRADFERAMPHSDPAGRSLHLGCAAALLNLRVAVAYAGWHPETRLLPDPADRELLATVRLTDPAPDTSALAALYPAIHQRHSSRAPFEETEIPRTVHDALAEAARLEGVDLTFPTSWHLEDVLETIQEAEARNITDPGSEQDLERWTRIAASPADAPVEGVPQYAFGPRKRGGKAPMRDFAGHRQVPDRDAADFERNPQLALLSTPHDHPEDWLRAGQAMQRVLLLATLQGLAGSFVSQPLEWNDLRWPLRDPVTGTGHPQMMLRLGYGPKGPGTPRRPVSEVLDIQP